METISPLRDDLTGKDLTPFSFTDNVLLAGILAKIYSESDYLAPIQNWAYTIPNRDLVVGDTTYRAGSMRRSINGENTVGVQLSIIDKFGKLQETIFFPIEALKVFSFTIQGLKIH